MKTVYWSPYFPTEQYPAVQLLYDTPVPLLSELVDKRNKENNGDNWYQCHAFLSSIKNTFVLKLPFNVTFGIDSDLGVFPIDGDTENMNFVSRKQPSVVNAETFAIRGNWIFWSEEPLIMTSSPAYYHPPVFEGHYVGGSFDIGKWFRPIEGACQLNPNVNTVSVKRNDPLAYVKFHTDEPIKFKRFYLNSEIEELSRGCVNYKRHEPHKSLPYLYSKFTDKGLNKVVTTAIKRNVVE